jgi:hypothetical protein
VVGDIRRGKIWKSVPRQHLVRPPPRRPPWGVVGPQAPLTEKA